MIRLIQTCAIAAACLTFCAASGDAAPPFRNCTTCAPVVTTAHCAPTYVAPTVVEEVRVREVLIPVLQPLPFFADPRISYSYGLGSYVQAPLGAAVIQQPQAPVMQQQQAPQVQAKKPTSEIDALIDQIEQRVRERQSSQAAAPSGPPQVPGFQRTSVIAARCASCHTGDTAKGQFKIFTSPGVWNPEFDPRAAWDAISSRRMPPREHPPLSAVDFAAAADELGFSQASR